jgi:hypothetical protein
VLTNNFSAEYGLTGSGIINITPRSGSNETTGEVFFITRPGPSIDGNPALHRETYQETKSRMVLLVTNRCRNRRSFSENKTFIISTLNILLILKIIY